MTALCGGGPSQQIPGKQSSFYLTGGALALLASSSGLTWLAEALGYVAGINFILSDICITDPPPDPGITAFDLECIFVPGNPLCNFDTTVSKLSALITRMAWTQWCQCVTPPTPAGPTPPVAPTGIITINPATILPTSGVTLCSDLTVNNAGPAAAGFVTKYLTDIFPGIDYFPGGGTTPYRKLPTPRPTSGQYTIKTLADGTTNTQMGYTLYGWNSSTNASQIVDNQISSQSVSIQTTTTVFTIPAAIESLTLGYASQSSSAPNNHFNVEFKYFCGGNAIGGTNTLGCCPPPADLVGVVQDVKTLVTQLQRYLLPFAYINGAVHSNLSGKGSFAISRLVGMHIHVSVTSAFQGTESANPDRIFDAGWVSCMDADGTIWERRIRFIDDIWLPRLFQECITFGYFLEPGVTATFTELEAEP